VFLQKEKPLYTTGWIVTVGIVNAWSQSRMLNRAAGRNVRDLHRPRNCLPIHLRARKQEEGQHWHCGGI
jgi:hypothetical protein